ncbi:hypothetical protein GCM10023203_37980 [Actinomycetospora straminea]|uniref:Uncharacterized protein n=1 Tax=Actinomycetospora straminea TaxID=663607 RepID=A0ABP9EM78_9PSEU
MNLAVALAAGTSIQLSDEASTFLGLLVFGVVFLLIWPMTHVGSHYLPRRPALWVTLSVFISLAFDMVFGFLGAGLADAGFALVGAVAIAVVYLAPALLGVYTGKRSFDKFRLVRAFRLLEAEDRDSTLTFVLGKLQNVAGTALTTQGTLQGPAKRPAGPPNRGAAPWESGY